ncbi:hypothetical protein VPHK367G1_0026 [Vibrio phage K367 g1]
MTRFPTATVSAYTLVGFILTFDKIRRGGADDQLSTNENYLGCADAELQTGIHSTVIARAGIVMDWKSIVGTVAPTIATALGGPMAGAAVKFLGDQFLGDENASEQQVSEFVQSANPETLLKIKHADYEFKTKMAKLGVDVFKIEADDKKNARKEHSQSKMPAILSVGLTVFIAGIVWLLFYVAVPTGAREVLFMLLGVVVKEWGNSMQYWFGTTRGSSEKNAMIKTK